MENTEPSVSINSVIFNTSLKILDIKNMNNVDTIQKELDKIKFGIFSKIYFINIIDCDITSIPNFSKLKKDKNVSLSIINSPRLTNLSSMDKTIKKLTIENLENIVNINGLDIKQLSINSCPSLKSIKNLRNLISLNCSETNNLISIENVPKLKNIHFGNNINSELQIDYTGKYISITSQATDHNSIESIENVKKNYIKKYNTYHDVFLKLTALDGRQNKHKPTIFSRVKDIFSKKKESKPVITSREQVMGPGSNGPPQRIAAFLNQGQSYGSKKKRTSKKRTSKKRTSKKRTSKKQTSKKRTSKKFYLF